MEISRVPSWSTHKIVSTYHPNVNKTPTIFVGFKEISAHPRVGNTASWAARYFSAEAFASSRASGYLKRSRSGGMIRALPVPVAGS